MLDELIIYMAPQLLGDTARGMFDLPELQNLEERVELQFKDVRMLGVDVRFLAVPQARNS